MAIADLIKTAGGASGVLPPISAGGGGPSRAESSGNYIAPAFDSSRWTVSTGSSKASSSEAMGTGASAGGAIPWALVAVAALVGLVLWKKL